MNNYAEQANNVTNKVHVSLCANEQNNIWQKYCYF